MVKLLQASHKSKVHYCLGQWSSKMMMAQLLPSRGGHCEWAVMNEKEGWEPLQWLPVFFSIFFVLHTEVANWVLHVLTRSSETALHTKTIHWIQPIPLMITEGLQLICFCCVNSRTFISIYLFPAVNSLRTPRWKFWIYLSWNINWSIILW